MKLEISGITIDVQKKKIKNMYLSVKPDGTVRLSAPLHMSSEQIEQFVGSKINWIKSHQKKAADRPTPVEHKYISGETIFFFGRQYQLDVRESINKKSSVVLFGDRIFLTAQQNSTTEQRESQIWEWQRGMLKARIPEFLQRWENRTGLHCTSWQIKYMTTRWGTCNVRTGKIWLNLQLAEHPTVCLEYVILHELAHLKVSNHGPDFTAILDEHMPDWRDVKDLLNGKNVKNEVEL